MIEVVNSSGVEIDERRYDQVVSLILEREKATDLQISLSFIQEDQIRKLNRDHRDKDEATDVLSFDLSQDVSGVDRLGQIVVCPLRSEDLDRAVIHGLLHILGYDHEIDDDFDRMKKKEEEYLNII